jgi:hypothetical protein
MHFHISTLSLLFHHQINQEKVQTGQTTHQLLALHINHKIIEIIVVIVKVFTKANQTFGKFGHALKILNARNEKRIHIKVSLNLYE